VNLLETIVIIIGVILCFGYLGMLIFVSFWSLVEKKVEKKAVEKGFIKYDHRLYYVVSRPQLHKKSWLKHMIRIQSGLFLDYSARDSNDWQEYLEYLEEWKTHDKRNRKHSVAYT